MPPELGPTTSASQLVAYTMCPRKYAFQYVYFREPAFRSISLLLGSAVHSATAWFFEERLGGKSPSVAAAEEILSADLMASTVGSDVRWKDATPDSLEADGRKLVRLYLERFGEAPVIAVEEQFQVDLVIDATGEVLGRPLRGFFDLVLKDGTVVELKTSARGWSEHDLVRHLQIGAYVFARNTLHGGPSVVEVHVLVKLKREPRIEVHRVERGESATRWWLTAAGEIESAIAARHFPPKPSPLCLECEYESGCAAWLGERAEPAVRRHLPVVRDGPDLMIAM